MRIGLIADIHGNLVALESVLLTLTWITCAPSGLLSR